MSPHEIRTRVAVLNRTGMDRHGWGLVRISNGLKTPEQVVAFWNAVRDEYWHGSGVGCRLERLRRMIHDSVGVLYEKHRLQTYIVSEAKCISPHEVFLSWGVCPRCFSELTAGKRTASWVSLNCDGRVTVSFARKSIEFGYSVNSLGCNAGCDSESILAAVGVTSIHQQYIVEEDESIIPTSRERKCLIIDHQTGASSIGHFAGMLK